jgi:hypothetical protein
MVADKSSISTLFDHRGLNQDQHFLSSLLSSETNASICESLQSKQLEKHIQLERRREQNREAQRRFRQRARAEAAMINAPASISKQPCRKSESCTEVFYHKM